MAVRVYRRVMERSFEHRRLNKAIPWMIVAAAVLLFVSAMLVIFSGNTSVYSPITDKCISCHNDTGYPNDTDMDGTTAPYKRPHNNTIYCEACHTEDLHNIVYINGHGTYGLSGVAATCLNCHQETINNSNFTNAPIIPPLKHSSNINNGSIWNSTTVSYWNSTIGACYYCHGDTKHTVNALGGVTYLLSGPNIRKGSLSNTTWCSGCHLNGINPDYKGDMWSPAPPLITVDNAGKAGWVNHSTYLSGGYNDTICKPCHALNGSFLNTSLNYSHSLDVGLAGTPNCIICHNLATGLTGGAPVGINFTAANASVHAGMNSDNATAIGYSSIIGSCWACHDMDGNVTSGHPDRYKSPKICDECHLGGGTYNTSAYGAIIVSEHFFSGTNIKAGNSNSNISSCITCHENVIEMIIPNNDLDTGTFVGDGLRLTGGNMSFYHYGKPRQDIRSWNSGKAENCSYCHQNTSTLFTLAMTDSGYNRSIQNHSRSIFTPGCIFPTCHSTGWIHNSSLTRPVLNSSNASLFCSNCHGNEKHNGTLDCGNCHINRISQDTIHPIKFLQSSGTYDLTTTNAVNCTYCHQKGYIGAPLIPDPLKHSSDPSSGIKWGNFWNNSSAVTACYYCHQSKVHLATGLIGNITSIKGSNNYNDTDLKNSSWCSACHYNNGSSNYKGDILFPVPPEILNINGNVPQNASDGTAFYNHSDIQEFDDYHCKNCHGSELSGYVETSRSFTHSVSEGGGGPACVTCHNTSGTGSPIDKRVDVSAMKQGVHRNLNLNAVNTSTIDPINKACWACHGDGTEPSGHPARYRSPQKCESNECHSLSQSSYNEKMVYSHFMNASRNSNFENATNYNITTSARCQECHLNSVVIDDGNQALAVVSHYGTKDELVDSFNCRYCHLDKDNSEDWGGATLINRNRTGLIELKKEHNLLKVSEGESIYLGEGYYLRLKEITQMRDEVIIQVLKGDMIMDESALGAGVLYKYETELIIDNSKVKTPVIILNITSIFKGITGFIQFEGFRIKKVHNEPESRNNSNCLACHLTRYTTEKKRYIVIDREFKENSSDNIFYTELFVDFNPDNKSKIYFADENSIITQFLNGEKYFSYPKLQKYLKEGDTWNIADNYALKLNEVSTDSKLAWLTLTVNGAVVKDGAVPLGYRFNYTPGLKYKDGSINNITVFTANVSAISQGTPNFVILTSVYGISPQVIKTNANSTLFGYNSSWLWPGETISIGKIPVNLHAPNLFTDQGGWGDCVKCHDASWNLGIAGFDAISTRLGKHSGLNRNASSGMIISDNIDLACWACHTDGEEPTIHSPTYKKARNCQSCHTYQEEPTYGAKSVGTEPHGLEENCENCHYWGSHNIIRFQVTPGIKAATLSPEKPVKGEKVKLLARAFAGYKMTINDVEYFIDDIGVYGTGTPLEPVDGSFDSQKEDVTGDIDTTNIPVGEHVIYIHVMERTDIWSEYYPVDLRIVETSSGTGMLNNSKFDVYSQWSVIIYLIIILTVAYFAFSRRTTYAKK